MVHEVMMKQTPPAPQLVSLSVRVRRETADALKVIADKDHRPVAAEMRRLIEQHIAAHEEKAA